MKKLVSFIFALCLLSTLSAAEKNLYVEFNEYVQAEEKTFLNEAIEDFKEKLSENGVILIDEETQGIPSLSVEISCNDSERKDIYSIEVTLRGETAEDVKTLFSTFYSPDGQTAETLKKYFAATMLKSSFMNISSQLSRSFFESQ